MNYGILYRKREFFLYQCTVTNVLLYPEFENATFSNLCNLMNCVYFSKFADAILQNLAVFVNYL